MAKPDAMIDELVLILFACLVGMSVMGGLILLVAALER